MVAEYLDKNYDRASDIPFNLFFSLNILNV